MIELKHLQALTDRDGAPLHLRLPSGAIYGILGPAGAGKERLLSLLAGSAQELGGSVKINGFDTKTDSIRARSCTGFLPKGAPLYGEMTVGNFLHFLAAARSVAYESAMRQIQNLLDTADLSDCKHTRIRDLTPSERARLAVLQTAVGSVDTLVLDTPFFALGEQEAKQVGTLISLLARERTVFVSSPNPDHLLPLCDRLLVLDRGRLVSDVLPSEFSTAEYRELCRRANAAKKEEAAKKPLPEREGKYELIDEESEDDR
ncbi:MAG: ABC transporter ATP-binding protein [Clostridia bacterium]|nr:ABC transporter ATP-binding protein [Clostridia bacterium]